MTEHKNKEAEQVNNNNETQNEYTHFGFQQVKANEKENKVKQVFSSVANNYDLMNDLMSAGLHRLWKREAISLCNIKPSQTILDLAGGTGDLSKLIHKKLNNTGKIVLADINKDMLKQAKSKLIDAGIIDNIEFVEANAQELPFEENSFDCVIIGFGLRNVTNKDKALSSIFKTLKPGGKLIVLEFSEANKLIKPLYDTYSFNVLPKLGKLICNDKESYQYLAESIRMHPNQEKLKM